MFFENYSSLFTYEVVWVKMGINIMLMEIGDVHSGMLHHFHLFPFQTVGLVVADILNCPFMSVNILT